MKYYYERPEEYCVSLADNKRFDHPLYNQATLYLKDGKGLAIIQQRFNPKTKMMWWGPIDPWLVDAIALQSSWEKWFEENADDPDENGLYPTFTVRKVMWAMRMKPLKKEIFETIGGE